MTDNRHPSPSTSGPNGESRRGSPSRSRQANPIRRSGPRQLSQTRGPEPSTNLRGVRLVIGTIGGTHGVRGELKLHVLSDRPDHLASLEHVYLGLSDTPTRLEAIRFPNDGALIKLAGIDNPEDGKKLGGLQVRIDASDAAPLDENEYFLFQLIGLQAFTPEGDLFGEVIDLIETGAHDVLVIRPAHGGDDILIPNHPEYVETIDPDGKRLVARIPVYLDQAENETAKPKARLLPST